MLISIIVPVYNAEKFLNKAIDSVINQSYKDIELILINDGSTDDSKKICNKYALADKRIKVISQKNKGPAAARNTGIRRATGDFIFFLDADDFIEKNAISLLVKSYHQTKADMIIGDFNEIISNHRSGSGHDNVFPNSKLLTKQDIIEYIRLYLKKPNKFQLLTFSWGRLFKSAIITDNNIFFNTDLYTFEDVAFNLDYLNCANKVFFLKETLYNHLIYNNDMSVRMMIRDNPKRLLGYRQALVNISNFFKKCNLDVETRKEVGHAYITLTISQLVRICGQINNKKKIYELIDEIINDSSLRDNLQFYSPSKGESKILPLLIKLKLVWPIILVCKHKSRRRYKYKK